MKQRLLSLLLVLLATATVAATTALAKPAPKKKKLTVVLDSAAIYQAALDSINSSYHYQRGHLVLPGGIGELTVPRGFRYLDSTQSGHVLNKLWHNPPQANLGMLFPDSLGPVSDGAWGYIIEYNDMGYVKDDDADDINYDELLETMQKEDVEANPARVAAGYEAIHLMGWGSPPYYDKNQHTLHWAKVLRFGNTLDETLNYNVRILGRKGVLVFNAVATPAQLPEIKASIPGLLSNVTFAKGQTYADYNPGIDEVAAYTIGGLVAGKVLAKVGFFAILAKFGKVIVLALGGALAALKRFFGFGKKEE